MGHAVGDGNKSHHWMLPTIPVVIDDIRDYVVAAYLAFHASPGSGDNTSAWTERPTLPNDPAIYLRATFPKTADTIPFPSWKICKQPVVIGGDAYDTCGLV